MFDVLRVRNFRRFVIGQAVSLTGTWMQRVAQDWLVLELSGNDPIALGTATALQFLPIIFLSLWAGVLADRLNVRKTLMVLQALMGLCALTLGLLDLGGVIQLWQVYLLCLALGCLSALDAPIFESFVVEMVGVANVPKAVPLNSMTFNVSRIVGRLLPERRSAGGARAGSSSATPPASPPWSVACCGRIRARCTALPRRSARPDYSWTGSATSAAEPI